MKCNSQICFIPLSAVVGALLDLIFIKAYLIQIKLEQLPKQIFKDWMDITDMFNIFYYFLLVN